MPGDISRLDHWRSARKHPETYPGERPANSYVLLDDYVCPLLLDDPGEPRLVTTDGDVEELEAVLQRAGLPALTDRVAVLAYGGNRNPATLRIKLSNYGYENPGTRLALPMLRGTIDGADVAACDLSGQGYLYGDLLVESPLVRNTRCEVWLALVDADQLRVLHESELGTDDYVGALFAGVAVECHGALRGPVLGYAARRPCFASPLLGSPIAFDTVEARHRSLPEMTPMQMLEHVLDAADLRERAGAIADANGDLALGVAHYLNRNWWRDFTGRSPHDGYSQLSNLVREWIASHSLERSTASIMSDRDLCLTVDEAYNPDASLTWARL